MESLNDADVAPNVGRAGSDTATTDFTSGKAAITLGSTASLKQILQDINGSFEVGTAYFPTIRTAMRAVFPLGGASLWALNNNDDAKQQLPGIYQIPDFPGVSGILECRDGLLPGNKSC